jgi:hypothetical protein
MRSDWGFQFSVFGFRRLRTALALCIPLASLIASFEISNLKSQIRAALGGQS